MSRYLVTNSSQWYRALTYILKEAKLFLPGIHQQNSNRSSLHSSVKNALSFTQIKDLVSVLYGFLLDFISVREEEEKDMLCTTI